MMQRIITGVVAGGIFLALLLLGGAYFQILVALLVIIAMQELFRMYKLQVFSFEGILVTLAALSLALPVGKHWLGLNADGGVMLFTLFLFMMLTGMVLSNGKYSFVDVGFPFLSAFYVGIGFQNLLTARQTSVYIVFLALFIVWATDIGAYAFGRSLKDRFPQKLLPSVSPNKTVVGSVGGIVSAVVVALVMYFLFTKELPQIGFVKLVIFTIIFSEVGQIGDLVESSIKRHFGVKDSGKILPGHGGILDRFDNLIFVFPIMHLLGLF
ncbi:phosphatidate cytidylyltransferase [Lactococcus lactis]|uniref:Phosphatidate cytidylyltransferase n=1 Tax=Lactococcus lactis TaxID=1358 RepID=A0A6M0M523_9LACT|nr:phosphatidate cytidylyltransferase [Lactococcus lactis]NEX50452.1 phosphatidate cytidylyltransferase [Lactococcus lactis]NEX54594.1 phosphatidate cytidylyltransferase [Lactococcus lactis]